jgi:hypothetical protein
VKASQGRTNIVPLTIVALALASLATCLFTLPNPGFRELDKSSTLNPAESGAILTETSHHSVVLTPEHISVYSAQANVQTTDWPVNSADKIHFLSTSFKRQGSDDVPLTVIASPRLFSFRLKKALLALSANEPSFLAICEELDHLNGDCSEAYELRFLRSPHIDRLRGPYPLFIKVSSVGTSVSFNSKTINPTGCYFEFSRPEDIASEIPQEADQDFNLPLQVIQGHIEFLHPRIYWTADNDGTIMQRPPSHFYVNPASEVSVCRNFPGNTKPVLLPHSPVRRGGYQSSINFTNQLESFSMNELRDLLIKQRQLHDAQSLVIEFSPDLPVVLVQGFHEHLARFDVDSGSSTEEIDFDIYIHLGNGLVMEMRRLTSPRH